MIAKYDGICKVTGQKIVAGVTEIAKIGGVWQAVSSTPAHPLLAQAQAVADSKANFILVVKSPKGTRRSQTLVSAFANHLLAYERALTEGKITSIGFARIPSRGIYCPDCGRTMQDDGDGRRYCESCEG